MNGEPSFVNRIVLLSLKPCQMLFGIARLQPPSTMNSTSQVGTKLLSHTKIHASLMSGRKRDKVSIYKVLPFPTPVMFLASAFSSLESFIAFLVPITKKCPVDALISDTTYHQQIDIWIYNPCDMFSNQKPLSKTYLHPQSRYTA